MTTAKKTTGKTADKPAASAPVTVAVDGGKVDNADTDNAPVEQPAPDSAPVDDGMVEVICLHEFNDLAEGCRRRIGDRFRVAAERADDILTKHSPALIAVIGGNNE